MKRASAGSPRRRFFIPEVVQTSAMDCGPASLKSLLEGFGISVSYGRLREACQTDVDGTSIDTIEDIAVQLGLDAVQIMCPLDHLLLDETGYLPGLIVIRLPNGLTHFVVIWRRFGKYVQVMDPATGRRWQETDSFLKNVYLHELQIPATAWRKWAGTNDFLNPLKQRLQTLGLPTSGVEKLVATALADPTWQTLGALDAATRMVTSLVQAGGIQRGKQARRVLESFFEQATSQPQDRTLEIPNAYWFVRVAPGNQQLYMRGAVLVRVKGCRASRQAAGKATQDQGEGQPALSPELVAALNESPTQPGRELLRLLAQDGVLTPVVVAFALMCSAAGTVIEALLFRGLFDIGGQLTLPEQRLMALAALLGFLALSMFLDLPIMTAMLRLGRHLEIRLRVAFLEKIPRLGDRYFQSRLTSDMAERSHSLQGIRVLPHIGGQFIQALSQLVMTTAGIIWLDPSSTFLAVTVAVVAVLVPILILPQLAEKDLRVRVHTGALTRFYLDSLLGLIPIRTHGAERAIRREHESLLVEWVRAQIGLLRATVVIDGFLSTVGFLLVVLLVFHSLNRDQEPGGMLLLLYWALSLPTLGQEVALIARQYPVIRNMTLRLLEPIGALEEPVEETEADRSQMSTVPVVQALHASRHGVRVEFDNISVRVSGHTILEAINVTIEPGSHVAIVGPSGAGKSSLVGLLLGWHRPASGQIRIDHNLLEGSRLDKLRQVTAWVDPSVFIWNRPLLENLRYGTSPEVIQPIGQIIDQANLHSVLETLPDGLQTSLGEGGALVSGGEGQRVRFGRALFRSGVRLVILDEPFRGLDREQRQTLLARARTWWNKSTLLCITHDVGETRDFDRVLVIEQGRLVEDGNPRQLSQRAGSRYQALLEAEAEIRKGLWSSADWRHVWLEKGVVSEKAQNRE